MHNIMVPVTQGGQIQQSKMLVISSRSLGKSAFPATSRARQPSPLISTCFISIPTRSQPLRRVLAAAVPEQQGEHRCHGDATLDPACTAPSRTREGPSCKSHNKPSLLHLQAISSSPPQQRRLSLTRPCLRATRGCTASCMAVGTRSTRLLNMSSDRWGGVCAWGGGGGLG